MDYHELKKLGADINDACNRGDFEGIRKSIGRMLSHIQSEQATTMDQGKSLHEHELKLQLHHAALYGDERNLAKRPGLIRELDDLKNFIRSARKFGWYAVTILTGLAIKLLWELLPKLMTL